MIFEEIRNIIINFVPVKSKVMDASFHLWPHTKVTAELNAFSISTTHSISNHAIMFFIQMNKQLFQELF